MTFYKRKSNVNPTLVQRRSPTSNRRWINVSKRRRTGQWIPQKKIQKFSTEFKTDVITNVNPTLVRRRSPTLQTNVGLTLVQRQFWYNPQKKILNKFSGSTDQNRRCIQR